MNFLDKMQDFIESLVNASAASTDKQKLQLTHFLWVNSVGFIFSIFFVIYYLVVKNSENLLYIILFLSSIIGIFYLIKTRINLSILYNILNFAFIILLVFLIQSSDPSGILWAYIYPICGIFLFGNRLGIFWSLIILITILLSVYLSKLSFGLNHSTFVAKFIITYFVTMVVSAWFSYYKELYYVKIDEANKKLEIDQKALEKEIIERKELEKKLTQIAHTDSLTNLINRRYFWELGNKEIIRALRYDLPICLAVLDVDHFKTINDTCGHPVGDEVLRIISRHCAYVLRENDLLGRIGGEEFAFLLVHVNPNEAFEKFEKLRKEIEALDLKILEDKAKFTVSIGLSPLYEGISTLGELYKNADVALYEAKKQGRNRVVLAKG